MGRYFKLDIANKKYRSVLLLSYSIIAIIAVAIVITGVFAWFNSYTQKVVYDMSMVQLQNLDTTFTNSIDTCRTQLQTAWQDSNIKQHIYTQNESWKNENWIGSYFQRLCVNNGFAEYICLFRNENEFRYYGWRYPSEAEMQQIEQGVMETSNDMEQFIIHTDTRSNLCIFFTERNAMGEKPVRGIIYSLDLDALEKTLISQNVEDTTLLVYKSDGQAVMKGKLSGEQQDEVWSCLKGGDFSGGSRELLLNDSKYLCNSIYNDSLDMHFVMLQDYHIMQTKLAEIKKAAFLSVIISLITALLLAVFLANKLYYPLEDFFSRIGSGPELIPGNEDYSKKQAEITSDKIISQIHMMSQQYHSDKILGYLGGNEADAVIPPVLRLQDRTEHCILILFWTDEHVMDSRITQDIHQTLDENHSGCKISSFSDARASWTLMMIKEPVRIGMLSDPDRIAAMLSKECRQIQKTVPVRIYYAVSGLISDENELRPAFRDLQTLQKYHLLGRGTSGMTCELLNDGKENAVPRKIYEGLLSNIRAGKTQDSEESISEILDELSGYEIRKVLLFLSDLCVQIEQCIMGCELTGRQRQEKYLDHYVKITSLYDKSDLEYYLKHLIEETCLENSVFQEKTLRMNMLDAVEYIRKHYRDDDICVELVADQFHMSVSYFSKLFNEYVGMTFPEFINDLRLTYASEMLRSNPEVNIKRVAEACGFGNTSYFSSQFKKKFSISPSAFRNGR